MRARSGALVFTLADFRARFGALMFTISAWTFTVSVSCGVCETDLGGNNLEAQLREIDDHGIMSKSVRAIWRLAFGSKLFINCCCCCY